MYNETIMTANKIITTDDLLEIFDAMNNELNNYIKLAEQEERKNQVYSYNYQKWTLKGLMARLNFTINFYDDTKIEYNNYEQFITIFNNRLHEIKSIFVHYNINYYPLENGVAEKMKIHKIDLYIREDKIEITTEIQNDDNTMKDIYKLITSKIINAPEKYDATIKDKNKIITKIGMSKGLIPSIIIMTSLILVPVIRTIYFEGYVIYPIATLLFGYLIGLTFCTGKINNLYEELITDKKYSHYDINNKKRVYVDDIDKYTEKSEVLIGKNYNNLNKRKEIKKLQEKYKNYMPIELMIIIIISLIIVICNLILK